MLRHCVEAVTQVNLVKANKKGVSRVSKEVSKVGFKYSLNISLNVDKFQ